MLSDRKKKYFRRKLQNKWDGISSKEELLLNDTHIHLDRIPDLMDRASSESDRTFRLVLKERESELLWQIRSAMERLDNDTYGICEECGDKITEGRLKVRPEARLCIYCKREQERYSRLFHRIGVQFGKEKKDCISCS